MLHTEVIEKINKAYKGLSYIIMMGMPVGNYDKDIIDALKASEDLLRNYKQLVEGFCDTEEHIRSRAKLVLDPKYIDGDSHFVPPIEDIVDTLVNMVKTISNSDTGE